MDADFCGLWGSEDPNDPVVAKSRTGYLLTLAGCPLMWVSKLQTETSVSTMMAEYVALSTAMRDMLPLREMVKTVAKSITGDDTVEVVCKSDVWEDNNGALTVATQPKITPQSKFFAVKLHFFREHVCTEQDKTRPVHIHKIDTQFQLADIFTKGLLEETFVPLRDRLMGWDLHPNSPPREHPHLGIVSRKAKIKAAKEAAATDTDALQGQVSQVKFAVPIESEFLSTTKAKGKKRKPKAGVSIQEGVLRDTTYGTKTKTN